MAAGDVAGVDAVDLEGDDLRLFQLGAEGADDRVERTHPAERARAPALRLRPGEGADRRRHQFGQHVDRLAAGLHRLGDPIVALLVGDDGRLVERGEAGALEEALDRLIGRADARALLLLAHVGALGGHADDVQRQAARRGIGAGALVMEARGNQPVGDHLLQILRRLLLHAGGDLFGEQFEKQFGHGRLWSGSENGSRRGIEPGRDGVQPETRERPDRSGLSVGSMRYPSRRQAAATVKRARTCAGFSISSRIATARSAREIVAGAGPVKRTSSLPTRYLPVRGASAAGS